MECTVTQDRRGKLFPAVGRVVKREGEAPVLDVLFDVVDVVKFKDAGKKVPQAYEERGVLIGEEAGCAAGRDAVRRRHYRVQAYHSVAQGLILLGEARDVARSFVAVSLRSAPDGSRVGAFLLIELPARDELIEPIGIRHVVEIVVLLPFLVHVEGPLVVAQLHILLVLRENERVVQPGEDHHHYKRYSYNNRDAASEKPSEKILYHKRAPFNGERRMALAIRPAWIASIALVVYYQMPIFRMAKPSP